jgi:hypothetical protein
MLMNGESIARRPEGCPITRLFLFGGNGWGCIDVILSKPSGLGVMEPRGSCSDRLVKDNALYTCDHAYSANSAGTGRVPVEENL